MKKDTIQNLSFKQLELILWRNLQHTYSQVLAQLLEELDKQIAENRDRDRFRLHDTRTCTITSLFGDIEIKRNYYHDRKTGKYVCLLDRILEFKGAKGISPLLEETAMEFAITGTSYRKAADVLEDIVGYRVISHETIRKLLLEATAISKEPEPVHGQVLFVEVDGLYVKRQRQKQRGKEEKIAAVHQGWEVNRKRVKLKNKRHFVHNGKEPFWEAFEKFLTDTYDYDPAVHKLVINGDGAAWITACREYFGNRAFYTLDRYHVAREIQRLFKRHPRYRALRKALAKNAPEKLLMELNSAVGTLEDESKEAQLENLIKQLEKYPEALRDYRDWLKEQGIDVKGFRSMGSAEATMSVFAKRLKNGRSWVDKGVSAMMTGLVAHMDKLTLKTLFGRVEKWIEPSEEKKVPKRYVKKVSRIAKEATRGNIPYLKRTIHLPVCSALKALKGF